MFIIYSAIIIFWSFLGAFLFIDGDITPFDLEDVSVHNPYNKKQVLAVIALSGPLVWFGVLAAQVFVFGHFVFNKIIKSLE